MTKLRASTKVLDSSDLAFAKRILEKPYARRLTPDEGGRFLASIQEFPGLIAHGASAVEALENLESAAADWIIAANSMGKEIPEPVMLHGFSGKIALRLPRTLHKRVAEMASCDATSINQWLTAAISHYLGGKQAMSLITNSFVQNHFNVNTRIVNFSVADQGSNPADQANVIVYDNARLPMPRILAKPAATVNATFEQVGTHG